MQKINRDLHCNNIQFTAFAKYTRTAPVPSEQTFITA